MRQKPKHYIMSDLREHAQTHSIATPKLKTCSSLDQHKIQNAIHVLNYAIFREIKKISYLLNF